MTARLRVATLPESQHRGQSYVRSSCSESSADEAQEPQWVQPGSLAVPYRDATRTETSLATYLGYASVEAMWDDVVTKPEVAWCARMKPYFDHVMNAG
jgi:hypothetical protein